ncbi:MAG: EAL domain-containing protein, partial [Burkholderiales bacterium]|nr:EAL domain-containing protein [Burkholderiales bacterium]
MFAFAITAIVLLLRSHVPISFANRPLLILLMLPVSLCALLLGPGPGLVSTATAVLGADLMATPHLHSPDSPSIDQFSWAVLIVNSVAVTLLSALARQSFNRLVRNRALMDAVVSGTTDAIFVKDLNGRYVLVNEAVSAFLGQPKDRILGKLDSALFDKHSADMIAVRDQEIIRRGEVSTHEETLALPDRKQHIFLVTKGPIVDAQNRVCGLFGVARDITEQKHAELELRFNESALRQAQHMANMGNWSWDMKTDTHFWSPEIYRIYGRDPALPPATYPDVKQYFTAETWEQLTQAVEMAIAQGLEYACDAEIIREDGTHRWVTTRGKAERDAEGKVIALHGTVQDITDRKLSTLKLNASEARLQRVVDATNDGFWDWEVETGRVFRSPRYYAITRTRPEDDTGDIAFFRRLIHHDDRDRVLAQISAHLEGQTPALEFDFRLATPHDTECWMRVKGRTTTRDDKGAAQRVAGTIADVTEIKRQEIALREAGIVFESTYEGIMVVDPDMRITRVNPAFTRITGYTAADIVGHSPAMLASGQHGEPFYATMWQSIRNHDFWKGEICNRRKSGEIFVEQLSISVVRDGSGKIQYYIGAFSDISAHKTRAAEVDRAAHYDPLTGLPNRRLLSDRLSQAILRSVRTGKSSAICVLDLDGFRRVNDQYGHSVGDSLLIAVADNIKSVLRAEDTLARLSGDEFAFILCEIATPEECTIALDRVLQVINQIFDFDGARIQVTASIGVSLFPDDNVDADTLLRHADQAMYMAKDAGQNRYQLFDPENDRKVQTRKQYLTDLHEALSRHEFVLYYQPKVDLVRGEIIGAEALIRWQHPERGLIAPAEFLPHLSGSELEGEFGDWVIRTAMAQLANWVRDGLRIKVSVNISANHLMSAGFYERLHDALTRHPDVPPNLFELEVLESAAIGDLPKAVDTLKQCKTLGVRCALDDFGTGYSSLTHLRRLPADTIKIDQSFVRDMLNDADDRGIVAGVIQLAKAFDLEVIAEGVETLEHGAMLQRLGCRRAQGYGIARPMPAAQFPA